MLGFFFSFSELTHKIVPASQPLACDRPGFIEFKKDFRPA
jgi:hypothetical protein